MENNILEKIKNNNRNQIKYFRVLETASEIALNITALANSGGGCIVFGIKDNHTYLEIKGIGIDYKVKKVLKELQEYCNKSIYKIRFYKENNKMLIIIKVSGLKRKIVFFGRRYIMDENMNPIPIREKIFISHSSKDKKYGDALVKLLRGLGFQRDQVIFTSDDDYGIPIDINIFEYLKNQINDGAYMIYLLSENYYESVACLNEMGAAWVIQNDYTVVGTPSFHFDNPKFSSGAIDPRRIGFTLDNKKRLVEFKNKLLDRFQLTVDEADWNRILDEILNV